MLKWCYTSHEINTLFQFDRIWYVKLNCSVDIYDKYGCKDQKRRGFFHVIYAMHLDVGGKCYHDISVFLLPALLHTLVYACIWLSEEYMQ